MQFLRVSTMQAAAAPFGRRLLSELSAGKRVLWLVPGGSNIAVVVQVMADVPSELTSQLTILLTDERYGPVGHKDSNTEQLKQAGFDGKLAKVIPVLKAGLSLEQTVAAYATDFREAAAGADSIIGQFGMGPDGHIAGMLPGSPAVEAVGLTCGYQTPTFTRVTLAPEALLQVQTAYVFAFGGEKKPALERLRTETVSLTEQPAQIIKQLAEAYVYNDQVDDK